MLLRYIRSNIYKFLLFSFIFIFQNTSLHAQCSGVLESDSLALIDLYYAVGGTILDPDDSWLETPISEREEIVLSDDGCSVIEINLENRGLQGYIPAINLPSLAVLNLSHNELTGEIPSFQSLTNLINLDLSYNELTGSIPNFDSLGNLTYLDCSSNQLTGNIPSFENLTEVRYLYLSDNELTGNIPSFENLINLIILNFSYNQLSGEIPSFENSTNLKNLYFISNQLTGNTPSFANLINLERIELTNNQLTGEIPDFENLINLKRLYLAHNQLTGEIPSFENLVNLEVLHFSNNQLDGTIPNFQNLTNLVSIFLQNNQLTGEIPNFQNLEFLDTVYLYSNNLTGEIPNFQNLPALTTIFLHSNQLTGSIPNLNIPSLRWINFSDNQLSGEIPNFELLLNVTQIILSDNQLTGTIPDFTDVPKLKLLKLSDNQLTGSIPDFQLPLLHTLTVGGNELSGEIPNFSDLPRLATFSVCPNNFIGNIPSFEECPFLNVGNIDFSCVEAAQTTGIIYADINGNCIKEENEPTIPNAVIATTDNSSYTFSNDNGFYALKTDTGDYAFNCVVPNYLWQQTCLDYPEAYTISMESYEDSLSGYDFGFQPAENLECPLIMVEVGTPLLRRCFTNIYHISYCNTGNAPAENAEIHLNISENIIPLESSLPYNLNSEEELVFNIGTLGIGQCGSFTLTDSLSCEAVLGSTACVEAYALPNDLCFENNGIWDGSDLEIEATCTGDEVVFTVTNVGESMETESEYRMYEDDVLSNLGVLQLAVGENLEFTRQADGKTVRLTVDQALNHPNSDSITAVIELCGAAPNLASLGFVNTHTNMNYNFFYDITCEEIIGSFDPNDKSVIPKGIGNEHRITASQELEYKIRFQNVGNDTAFRVVIIDTIDTDFLDINTLTLGISSHDYETKIENGNILSFTFDDILLVDSVANEPESHGFITFKISQKAGNQRDDLIINKAAIYFDYNAPVITNRAFNTIGLPDSTTAIPIITKIENDIPVSVFYENAYLHIKLAVVESSEEYSLILYDVLGKQITHANQLSIPHHNMFVGNLTKGVYLFEIKTRNGKKASSKFIVP